MICTASVKAELSRAKNCEDIRFFGGNIESVQGGEKDVIVFSQVTQEQNKDGSFAIAVGSINRRRESFECRYHTH